MSTRPNTGARTWLSAGFAAILTASTWLAAQAPDHPQSFTTVQNGFAQQLIGTTPSLFDPEFGILGGVAFAPNGDVWSSECLFSNTRMHRFDIQTTITVNGTPVHPESIVEPPPSGSGGCGLVNHPDGYMYSNSMLGIWRLDAETGLPVGGGVVGGANAVPGNSLGLAVDPQTEPNDHIVYVGSDCHPSLSPESTTCTLYDLDLSTGATLVFARLNRAEGMFLDGIYFDPSGNYIFAAHREIDFSVFPFQTHHSLAVIRRPASLMPMDVTASDAQIAQLIPMAAEPDGVAFHATEGFVVTLNESDGGAGVGGTISRFDFPGGYEASPVPSVFASGGFRGDLLQVGADGCIYATQGKLYESGGHSGTRYDNGDVSSDDSIVQICGGFAPPPAKKQGSVAGVVYHDVNQNGVRDSGEPGIGGVTVTLSGATSATTTTAADGSYSFASLAGGSYSVSAPNTANNLDRETASPLDASIAAGDNRTGLDFGYVSGGLSGTVYADLNRNGARDSGEPGIGGVTVTLFGGSGATTTSAPDGTYSFTALQAGSYDLSSPGSVNGLLLGTAGIQSATLVVGGSQDHLDFGYVNGSLAGTVYADLNRNGVRDSGEPGLSGVTVTLGGASSGTAVSSANGSYTFSDLTAGSYTISSPATAQGLALHTTSPLTPSLAAGEDQTGHDFGYVSGGLSGFAYVDANRNGIKDASEAGLGGVVISGPGGTATTAADGGYSFSGLQAGTYSVSAPSTASGKALFTVSPLTVAVSAGATSADNNFGYVPGALSGFAYVDANRNGIKDASEAGLGGVVISGPGGTTTTAADGSYSFSNLDAGTYPVSAPSTASGKSLFTASPLSVTVAAGATSANNNFGYVTGALSGFAYVDANRNGVKDAAEAGIGGVAISGPGGSTMTAADGSYSFSNLDAGTYPVSAPSTASGKALFTASPLSVSVAAGATSANNNFGYVTGAISGYAYVDANRNGVKDAGEAGLGGVIISGPGGSTTTAADGSYGFSNLDAGTYPVSAPSTASGKALFTTSPLSVTIAAGATSANNNFGYVTGTISGFAYVDANRNGVKDAGEAGISGVVITRTGATATTAADGSYSFSGLDAGTYSVSAPATAAGKGLNTPSPLSVTLAAGATSANNNFGYVSGAISGYTYFDANANGVRDSGEAAVANVPVTLAGVGTVNSDASGFYSFSNLNAATYSDSAAATTSSGLTLITPSPLSVVVAAGQSVTNVNFGYLNLVTTGYTGSTGYWKNQNGQALIKSVNGGPNATNFATWLSSNFPYLYGANAGANNLTGKKNTDVAALFVNLFSNNKPEAQVMAVAIASYVTSSTLAGGNYAASYGFVVTPAGAGGSYYNIGTLGTAIGLPNNTYYTLMQIVQQANLRKQQSQFDPSAFTSICSGINQAGHIV